MTCAWPLPASVEHLKEEWNTAPPGCRDYGVDMASRALELLTAGRVGVCPVTIRPNVSTPCCAVPISGNYGMLGLGTYPVTNWAGTWWNGPVCFHGNPIEVALPAPVGRIDEVKVNGVVLDEADYRLDSGYLLTWVGAGVCPFPRSQDFTVADTEDGTMSVTYVNAHLPGSAGSLAMSILAYEFLRACMGKPCKLPDSVTTIVRQGITMTVTPGHWPNGKTGISDVDSFIALWNPQGMMSAPQVWSPDLPVSRTIGG